MTSKELKEMLASGAIKYKDGKYVSSVTDKIVFKDDNKPIIKAQIDPIPLKPYVMPKFKKAQQSSNVRVKNAKKIVSNGIKFDSKLEKYMYDLLIEKNINFEFQHTIVLQDKFKFKNKSYRAITWRADFYLPDHKMIIDTKGFPTEIFKLKLKMFYHKLYSGEYQGYEYLEFPSSQKACLLLAVSLKK